ncbi:hypothetical protein [Staphylococcus massiliensis]|uniref:Phage protein n=1 Tax=Staphylococcus massiliensis S46 TaxID=1229783 RepID=K9ASF5_9STAP|nr:hypothetical protein [Staphylococcus massiliensis]EKU50328.1 hypothetical protein C273_01760 [Staphylococcus massiliensis S46]
MYTRTDIKKMIDDYKWMRNIIESQVYDNDSTSTAQYGIESVMPKGKGGTGNKVLVKVMDRDKVTRRNKKLVQKIAFIDKYEDYITNDKNYHILQLLKQGESHKRIMIIMNINSRGNFYSRVNEIVNTYMDVQEGQYDD